MAILLRFLIPIVLFRLVRWVVPLIIGWMGRRYDRQQAEERSGGPVIEGHPTRPTRDLRSVDFDRE